jgi:hypothetical protein
VLSGEAINTNFIVLGLTRPGLEPTIYRTEGERTNHYATDAVMYRIRADHNKALARKKTKKIMSREHIHFVLLLQLISWLVYGD